MKISAESRFRQMDLSTLVDMLARYTSWYTKILSAGVDRQEQQSCRKVIQSLQDEIQERNRDSKDDH